MSPMIGFDPFNMPTQASQFQDPNSQAMLARLGAGAQGAPPPATPGMAEGGTIPPEIISDEAPAEVREIVMAALAGELPPVESQQLLEEVSKIWPDLIMELTNEMRTGRSQAAGRAGIVTEGLIPPFGDGLPESSGAVDDRVAVSKDDFIKEDFERRLATGGAIQPVAAITQGEFIINKGDVEGATKEEMMGAASSINPETPPGASVWEDFVSHLA